METIVIATMSLVLSATLYLGALGLKDLNDGRIDTVVKQMTGVANAKTQIKRK